MTSSRQRVRPDSIPRTVAGARRAARRTRRRLVREAAQLRAALNDAAMNLGVGIESRERNVKLAFQAREIMNQTRAERERIIAATALRAKMKERVILATLTGSLALLSWSAWNVLYTAAQ